MSTQMSSPDRLARNNFLGQVRSSWNKAYTQTLVVTKDMKPVRFIYLSKDDLILDKSHLLSPKYYKESPTKFLVRIRSKGLRRIYKGFDVLGYKWFPSIEKFVKGMYGKCHTYTYIEVDREQIVVILEPLHDLDALQI
jgi:hypothetical protein